MFGCFTRNIYASKICLHFLCASELSQDSLEERKHYERASIWWGVLVSSFQEAIRKHSQVWFWALENSCKVRAETVLKLSWKAVLRGRAKHSISHDYSSLYLPCVHDANHYMYIQAVFTDKYLHWCRMTCSQSSLPGMAWHIDCNIWY